MNGTGHQSRIIGGNKYIYQGLKKIVDTEERNNIESNDIRLAARTCLDDIRKVIPLYNT